ncbi:kinase-like domain-containing protein [Chaetomium tenue]|uniref:Kinase-like domain-containing protein n=1 Tax=Chaetomium tenue TaxID=1854479 RepID=A0ACB7PE56_9PEZI|nr:kinase-like domain-containing protein [Chaetomium globosum]
MTFRDACIGCRYPKRSSVSPPAGSRESSRKGRHQPLYSPNRPARGRKSDRSAPCHHKVPPAKAAWERCVIPREQPSKRRSASRRERQSTEPLEARKVPALDALPYVELRLSDTPQFRSGFVFGCGPDSDVVLPNNRGVGYHHFSLTFDDKKRLIVKDWGSLNGTQVTYGKQGHGVRRRFQWILGGHRILFLMQPVIASPQASPPVQLQIIVFLHDIASPAYIERVDRLFQNTPATEDLLSSLDIASRPVTERPTGAHTPDTGPIHLRKRLGKGSFAVVVHYWNVSTGEEYALKEPSGEAHRRGRVRINAWRNEAHIMNLISHPHIVKLLKSDFTQGPRLHLEYIPGGSLADQRNISAAECVSILQQCLSALEYLHGSDPPIVHRDIKADNILVQYRDTNSIYVKFADFGLAKDYDNMSTICGNFPHLAPEVYENHQYAEAGGEGRVSYTEAVDIWSLGIMVYELLCPLPQFENRYISSGTAWPKKLIEIFKKDFEERPDELRRFLLDAMVVLLPEQRWSAGDCLAKAALLSAPAMDQSETGVAVSYVSDDERSTIRCKTEPSMAQGLERQPGSSDAGRYDRSGAPTPWASVPASASSRKRVMVSTSSSSGRHSFLRMHWRTMTKIRMIGTGKKTRVDTIRKESMQPCCCMHYGNLELRLLSSRWPESVGRRPRHPLPAATTSKVRAYMRHPGKIIVAAGIGAKATAPASTISAAKTLPNPQTKSIPSLVDFSALEIHSTLCLLALLLPHGVELEKDRLPKLLPRMPPWWRMMTIFRRHGA